LEDFWKKTMQTLTAGSFLNLENASSVEALKHTAHRLAEHSSNVIKENLQPAALEALANNLWLKAEYVTRETERRRLQQIFVENFSERFRQLKPDDSTNSSPVATSPPAPEIFESGGSEPAVTENVSLHAQEENTTVAQGKKDEFLGFVQSSEACGGDLGVEAGEAAMVELKETQEKTAQADGETALAETSQKEAQAIVPETPENSDQEKTKTTVAAAAASIENKPLTAATTSATANASKNGTGAPVEPFEFEKCTINLNLTLLPAEPGKGARKAIVGAASHNLPPEIDFLNVADGGDLNEIAALISEKLARFKQTLPVKYIEQLRASKNKSAKKGAATAQTTAATVPQYLASDQANCEKTSGGQKTQEESDDKTVTPQARTTDDKGNAAPSIVPNQAVNQPVAANSIQGSLF
jgi:hypothetical protein